MENQRTKVPVNQSSNVFCDSHFTSLCNSTEDPLDFSFSTPSSEGLETMSSDEDSSSPTRAPLSGQCFSLQMKSTARVHSPDTRFSQNGGTAITTQLLSIMSTYRKSPRGSTGFGRGGGDSGGGFRKSFGGGSSGDHQDSMRTNIPLNTSYSFSPAQSTEVDGVGLVSPTQHSRSRSEHKPPSIPLSTTPVHPNKASGKLQPSGAPCSIRALNDFDKKTAPGSMKKKKELPKALGQSDNQKAKILSFLGGSTREKGVIGS